jgi:hypothetical protein
VSAMNSAIDICTTRRERTRNAEIPASSNCHLDSDRVPPEHQGCDPPAHPVPTTQERVCSMKSLVPNRVRRCRN